MLNVDNFLKNRPTLGNGMKPILSSLAQMVKKIKVVTFFMDHYYTVYEWDMLILFTSSVSGIYLTSKFQHWRGPTAIFICPIYSGCPPHSVISA